MAAPVEEMPVEVSLLDDHASVPDTQTVAMPAVAKAAGKSAPDRTVDRPLFDGDRGDKHEHDRALPIRRIGGAAAKEQDVALDARWAARADDRSPRQRRHLRRGARGDGRGQDAGQDREPPGAQADADLAKAQARLHSSKFVESASPGELTAARFDLVAARQAKKEVELVEQKDGTYTSDKTTFKATVNLDGTVKLTDKANWDQKSLFFATFDATDALMRRLGQNPYASEKRKFLDRTRDQRVEVGKRYRSARLAQSAQIMAGNLARLWATGSGVGRAQGVALRAVGGMRGNRRRRVCQRRRGGTARAVRLDPGEPRRIHARRARRVQRAQAVQGDVRAELRAKRKGVGDGDFAWYLCTVEGARVPHRSHAPSRVDSARASLATSKPRTITRSQARRACS